MYRYATMIRTRYLAPTDTLGARIVATWSARPSRPLRRVIGYDHASTPMDAHAQAMRAMVDAIIDDVLRTRHAGTCPAPDDTVRPRWRYAADRAVVAEDDTGYVWLLRPREYDERTIE